MPQPYACYFWNVCRSRTPLVEKAKNLPKPFNGSITGASKLSVIRIQSVNSMSHIELEILIRFGKTGVSMTHVIRIRDLIRIRLCHGNRANMTAADVLWYATSSDGKALLTESNWENHDCVIP